MDFTGRIHFDFEGYDVWRVYTTILRASEKKGVTIGLEWRAFLIEDLDRTGNIPSRARALGAYEAVREAHPDVQGRFLQALLTLAFQEKDKPGESRTLAVAARVAGLDADDVIARAIDPGLDLVEAATAAARDRGVTGVPTIVRDGPPVYIKTTGAANYGDAVARLELINGMLDDDGIWSMSKP